MCHHGRYAFPALLFFISHMASPPRALPEGVEDTVLAEIIGCLSSDKAFSKSESLWEQRVHARRILHRMQTPTVPFAAIAELLSVDKGAIRKHWQNFNAQENVLLMWERPTVRTTEEVNEIVDVILNTQITPRL
jgi:hypothetical protein